ncbi:PIG-L family deacetylase [Persicobacter psychrovividus]|uniref:PIG-L family deacetylase n=1 Tax=Persicobacter psychrovividus TaxID=387638 RepID=A0ABM7VEJ5_9BACT|nr:hypothetical protein PEPS_16410 [Persicobacter psychrovividus]
MKSLFLSFLALLLTVPVFSQTKAAAETLLKLQQLPVASRVLYMAAHPDDENTRLISYLQNVEHIETAYLSLTRGDGGQNLIGPELWEGLGLIRTQELLAARSVDHGQQFFSRAYDFGYSKHPDETFEFWKKDAVLSDVVKVIREFRPDVIITRFPTIPGITHGHHTASAILALEGAEAAANPKLFKQWGAAHQVKRVLWNTSSWFYRDHEEDFKKLETLKVDIGRYQPLLGTSVAELAALSRSQHKSQGFGTMAYPGEMPEYFQALDGQALPASIMESVDQSWGRFAGGEALMPLVNKILSSFSVVNPAASVKDLLQLRTALQKSPSSFWQQQKLQEVDGIITDCLGLFAQLELPAAEVYPAEQLKATLKLSTPFDVDVKVDKIKVSQIGEWQIDEKLSANELYQQKIDFTIPANFPLSQPYWLRNAHSAGMFKVTNAQLIGDAQNAPTFLAKLLVKVSGQEFSLNIPVVYQSSDPVKGLIRKPVLVTPMVEIQPNVQEVIFGNQQQKTLQVKLKSKQKVKGILKVESPKNWGVTTAEFPLTLNSQSQSITVKINSPEKAANGFLKFTFVSDQGAIFDQYVQRIEYDHIPTQMMVKDAKVSLKKMKLEVPDREIGYIMGAGDLIPEALREVGMSVKMIDVDKNKRVQLQGLDVVILGVRALNTLPQMKDWMPSLIEFVAQGGTVITQYNTSHRLKTDQIGPYPLKLGRNRVTNELAKVSFVDAKHPVLNNFNKIGQDDFSGWVQERGLYFPQEWDKAYQPILRMADDGESPLESALLVAQHGKGVFVYTSLSFFRELPAGVNGAYRLFSNIIGLQQGQFMADGK